MTNRPSAERGADSPPVPVRTEHFSSAALPKTPRSRGPADSLGMRGLGSRTKPVRPAPGAASPFPRTAADQPAPQGRSTGTAIAAQPYHGKTHLISAGVEGSSRRRRSRSSSNSNEKAVLFPGWEPSVGDKSLCGEPISEKNEENRI